MRPVWTGAGNCRAGGAQLDKSLDKGGKGVWERERGKRSGGCDAEGSATTTVGSTMVEDTLLPLYLTWHKGGGSLVVRIHRRHPELFGAHRLGNNGLSQIIS